MNSIQFYRALVVLNGMVPLLVLGWDTVQGELGANPVNYALHVTGILSLVCLCLALAITPLRWVTGWGGWVAFRRALGLYAFFYSVVHVAIYVGLDRGLSIASTLNEIWLRRFLQVGLAAVILMVPLAATSTNTMVKKLGSRRWKLLHRLAYVVTALAVVHYYMLVKSDIRQPLAFAGIVTGLLGVRFGKHYFDLRRAAYAKLSPMAKTGRVRRPQPWKGELTIESISQVTADVKTFRFRAPTGGPLPFDYQPGQFMNLQLQIDGKRVNRCYTIASSPTLGNACELTIRRDPNGLASRFLHDNLKVGDCLNVIAPAGKFVFTGAESPAVLLIAGGVGITPLMSMARYLTDRNWNGSIYFVVVARTEREIIFYQELQNLHERFPNFHLSIALTQVGPENPWAGHRGYLTDSLLREVVSDLEQVPVYLCGPNGMMEATRELLLGCGVPEQRIHTEEFVSPRSASTTPEALSTNSTLTTSKILFKRSNLEAEFSVETSVLEAAEESSIELPNECRAGICGQCKTRLLTGSVEMASKDALSAAEIADGWILACQAYPRSDVVVEA